MSNLNSIYNQSYPLTKEDFRMMVEVWQSKGHEHVVRVEFDEETGEMILVVQDYVDPNVSGFIKVAPWSQDEYYYHT